MPYQFVIDLETREVLGKDSLATGSLTADQIVALVENNNL